MEKLLHLAISDISPDPNQPRKDFDLELLKELSDSIRAVGVIQAITVRPSNGLCDTEYMIIAGERRWRASTSAGLTTIPAILIAEDGLTDDAIYKQQLTENLHRQDLNPVEKAEFIKARIDYLKSIGVTNAVETVAEELGVSTSWVSKNTQVLKYADDIRKLARNGLIKDYNLLKKIDQCKGHKRDQAIELIQSGQFNAKDFFARKRYDSKPTDNKPREAGPGTAQSEKETVKNQFKYVLDKHTFLMLVKKTDFKYVIEKEDPDWQEAPQDRLHHYCTSFMDWVSD